ncbi:MAG: thiolase family protein [Chloroflexota bacterium]|nr:MAG: thiolase family protein [Chloroflexota bacterium]
MGRVYGRDGYDFAAEAIKLAMDDAGLDKRDIDGLLINTRPSATSWLQLQNTLGFRDLKLINQMYSAGATAGTMVQYATMAIEAGLASAVAIVFADAPLTESPSSVYTGADVLPLSGMAGLKCAYGYYGAHPGYALAAKRHMHLFGTTSRQLGAIAVAERAWAVMNPHAQMRKPITIEDHQNSRYVVEPLRLLDCCLVSNGGVAVIVTSAERAGNLRQPAVYVLGMAQASPGDDLRLDREPGIYTGAAMAGEMAFRMAGVTVEDIDILELYDCFTYTVLVTLEDYGFCKKGEGGAFVEDGRLGPGGSLPTNTGGGQLSGYYMWGMTPLSEAVIQARGHGYDRQVSKNDLVLVSGNGSTLNQHSTLILSKHQS